MAEGDTPDLQLRRLRRKAIVISNSNQGVSMAPAKGHGDTPDLQPRGLYREPRFVILDQEATMTRGNKPGLQPHGLYHEAVFCFPNPEDPQPAKKKEKKATHSMTTRKTAATLLKSEQSSIAKAK
jgi:hypothetical protein